MEIPPRMYSSDVVKLAKVSMQTLKKRQREGLFPRPIDRGRQDIYLGHQVYEALGLVTPGSPKTDQQRWATALEGMS